MNFNNVAKIIAFGSAIASPSFSETIDDAIKTALSGQCGTYGKTELGPYLPREAYSCSNFYEGIKLCKLNESEVLVVDEDPCIKIDRGSLAIGRTFCNPGELRSSQRRHVLGVVKSRNENKIEVCQFSSDDKPQVRTAIRGNAHDVYFRPAPVCRVNQVCRKPKFYHRTQHK